MCARFRLKDDAASGDAADSRMTQPMARVLLLGIDGCPLHLFSPVVMPRIWALGDRTEGRTDDGRTADGRSPLPSSTYPCFSSILTGCHPARHGVRSTSSRPGAVPGWAGQPRVMVPTLFDACRAAGLRSAAIQGDHLLLAVLRTEAASITWPPGGAIPPGTPLDDHAYPTNAAVRPHLLAAVADPSVQFLFGQINEGDTLGHDLGPDHPATRECYAAADALVGEVLEAARSWWEQTLVIVVSDHGMEPRTDHPPIDLLADAAVGSVAAEVLVDGGAALVRLRDGVPPAQAGAALKAVTGVGGWGPTTDGVLIAEAKPGWIFGNAKLPAKGFHGGPATARTFAVVGGGHPSVPAIARAISGQPVQHVHWAPTIARVLGLRMPDLDGRVLLSEITA